MKRKARGGWLLRYHFLSWSRHPRVLDRITEHRSPGDLNGPRSRDNEDVACSRSPRPTNRSIDTNDNGFSSIHPAAFSRIARARLLQNRLTLLSDVQSPSRGMNVRREARISRYSRGGPGTDRFGGDIRS